MTTARIPVTRKQAGWLSSLYDDGSESYCRAVAKGLRLEDSPRGEVLIVPEAAFADLGLAVGIRADIVTDEGTSGGYTIGDVTSILSLARKLAANGVTAAAPLTPEQVFGR